jgi:hypothetical protein
MKTWSFLIYFLLSELLLLILLLLLLFCRWLLVHRSEGDNTYCIYATFMTKFINDHKQPLAMDVSILFRRQFILYICDIYNKIYKWSKTDVSIQSACITVTSGRLGLSVCITVGISYSFWPKSWNMYRQYANSKRPSGQICPRAVR